MRTAFEGAARSATGLAYESYFDGSTAFGCQFSIHDSVTVEHAVHDVMTGVAYGCSRKA